MPICQCVRVCENYHKMSQIKVAWYVFRVKNMHSESPSNPWGPWGKAKMNYVNYFIRQGKAKLHILSHFSVLSPTHPQSQAAVDCTCKEDTSQQLLFPKHIRFFNPFIQPLKTKFTTYLMDGLRSSSRFFVWSNYSGVPINHKDTLNDLKDLVSCILNVRLPIF